MRNIVIPMLVLAPLSASAIEERSYWCTANGITLTYAKEQVWGADQASLVEAMADSLARCRTDLSQCQVEECFERRGTESLPHRFE